MHFGATLLGHLRSCRNCNRRVHFALSNPSMSLAACVREANKEFPVRLDSEGGAADAKSAAPRSQSTEAV